jgi:chaperonin GroEL
MTIKSNIINDKDYKEVALETLVSISSALAKSVGFYGSTTVIENQVYGDKITKDGFSILREIKFDPDNTVSNTILRIVNNISRDLVETVGDGSTSSILTAERLFKAIDSNESLKKYPKRIIFERLNDLGNLIEIELLKTSTPITEDNFEVLRSISAVSNNNDQKTGDIIYNIYKEIGADGFIFMEDSNADKDFYEVTDGIEFARGYYDKVYANKANRIDAEFQNPRILMVNGDLDKNDINWMEPVMRTVLANAGRPLVIIATGFHKEFSDWAKINKINNKQVNLQIALTTINNSKPEIFDDLAIYLGGKILDKNDSEDYFNEIDSLQYEVEVLKFIDKFMGNCEIVKMDNATSQYIKGAGSKEEIDARVEMLEEQKEYFLGIGSKRDVTDDVFKIEKRIGSLKSKVARLFVTGTTDIERETRKYLLEDSIYACRSALKNGYIAGGNMAIPKIIKDKLIDNKDNDELDLTLLSIIKESFIHVFELALENMGTADQSTIKSIIDECMTNNEIYNLVTLEFEKDSETKIINSVYTDIEIMKSSFSIIGLLATSNQYLQKTPN